MQDEHLLACLDIGKTLIHLMIDKTTKETDGAERERAFLGYSYGIRNGAIYDAHALGTSIRSVFADAGVELGCEIEACYLGVDAMLTRLTKVQGKIEFQDGQHHITRQDIDRVLLDLDVHIAGLSEAKIDLFPIVYSLDNNRITLDPSGHQSNWLGVTGFLLQRRDETLLHLLRCLRYAGIRVKGLVHIGLAVGEVFLSRDEKQQGTLVVDLGAEGSRFYYFKSGFMQAEVFVPLGGRTLTEDIAKVLGCQHDIAQSWKYRCGFSSSSSSAADTPKENATNDSLKENSFIYEGLPWEEVVPQILQARLEQIFIMANDQFIESGYDTTTCSIKLLGGESLLLGLAQWLSSSTGVEVEIIKPSPSQVAQPAFTSTFAMVQYLHLLDREQSIREEIVSWIDVSEDATLFEIPAETFEYSEQEIEEYSDTDISSSDEMRRNPDLRHRIDEWRLRTTRRD